MKKGERKISMEGLRVVFKRHDNYILTNTLAKEANVHFFTAKARLEELKAEGVVKTEKRDNFTYWMLCDEMEDEENKNKNPTDS